MTFTYTTYRSLYDLQPAEVVRPTWPELVQSFSRHARFPAKFDAPGFGPYELEAPSQACRHPHDRPHRCDACVWSLTLAVFDADQGGAGDVQECQRELCRRGFAHLWYSSFSFESFQAVRIPLRLVIPLAVPFDARRWSWSHFRAELIRALMIPADSSQCGGRSHFYFLPAARPGTDVWVESADTGRFLHPADFATPLRFRPRGVPKDWAPAPAPTGTVELAPLIERLRSRMGKLRRGTPRDKLKATWLERALEGEALADHGERNSATLAVAGVMAWVLPDQPPAVLAHLLRPSLDRMVDAGSRLTPERVLRDD